MYPEWARLTENPLKIVVIAGPYIGDGRLETIERNIREAELYAVALANRGIGFFCPHLHTHHLEARRAGCVFLL
jgi:predicted methyltransferase MtxX (methanogen marker protein 4)